MFLNGTRAEEQIEDDESSSDAIIIRGTHMQRRNRIKSIIWMANGRKIYPRRMFFFPLLILHFIPRHPLRNRNAIFGF